MPGARISRQLLSQARTGTIASLWTLNDRITPETCSREVIDVVLMHLEPDLIPVLSDGDRPTTLHLNAARRGLACTRAIPTLAKACSEIAPLKATFVTQVTSKLHEICTWSLYTVESFASFPRLLIPGLLDLENVYLWQADMLFEIIHLDDHILRGLVSERAFLKLLTDLWSGQPRQGQFAMRSTDHGRLKQCPIIYCMLQALGSGAGHQALAEYVVAEGSERQRRFLEGIAKRLGQFPEYREDGCVGENIVGLLGVAQRIVRQAPSLHVPLQRARFYGNFVAALSMAFHSITTARPPHPHLSKVAQEFLEHIAALCRLLGDSPSRVPRAYAEILSLNLVPLMVRLATAIPSDGRAAAASAYFAEICGYIGRYAYFPSVAKQLHEIEYSGLLHERLLETPYFSSAWRDFKGKTDTFVGRLQSILSEAISLCDNPWCPGGDGITSKQ